MLIGGNGQLLPPDNQQQGSSSRSPSPHNRVPRVVDSPHQADFTAPSVTQITRKLIDRSRTPSPDKRALLHASVPPGRAPSPLGRNMRVPRPLPNPFSRGNGSQQSLGSTPNPSRSGTGSTVDHADDEDVHALAKPSRKALGKRRAVVDEDSKRSPVHLSLVDVKQIHSIRTICLERRMSRLAHPRRVRSRTRHLSQNPSAMRMMLIRRSSTAREQGVRVREVVQVQGHEHEHGRAIRVSRCKGQHRDDERHIAMRTRHDLRSYELKTSSGEGGRRLTVFRAKIACDID